MNTGIMKLVGEIIQINPNRSRPIHLIVCEIFKIEYLGFKKTNNRVLVLGVV
jgi:hypothetical protein